jgi:hypothetical protein
MKITSGKKFNAYFFVKMSNKKLTKLEINLTYVYVKQREFTNKINLEIKH